MRRSWLLAQLSARLDYCALGRGALGDVLALGDDALIAALGGRRRAELEREYGRYQPPEVSGAGGRNILCRHDQCYPAQLRHPGGPGPLFLAGDAERLRQLAAGPVVAIIGERKASDYGMQVAGGLARGLAASGVTVACGLGDGIATAAQEGALDAGGPTVTVLGGGLDVGCPARKRSLRDRLLRLGCVVSELPDDCKGRRWGGVAGERIVAGLAEVTVVVESSAEPSSTMGVTSARGLERIVAAVPGRVTSPLSRGPHAMLSEGAPLVRDAGDVLELLGRPATVEPAGVLARPRPRSGAEPGGPARLPVRLREVLDLVGAGRDTPDKLEEPGRDPGETLLALSELELMGLLARGDGGRYVPSAALVARTGPGEAEQRGAAQ
jgi:DNA processing protein